MECKLCKKEVKSIIALSIHLAKGHKLSKEGLKEYYDKYLKDDNEGKCYFCGSDAKFHNLSKGYHRICSSKECLGKTRATGTYEFLMYKYGYTENEAKIEQQKRADKRGGKIKESFDKLYEEDRDFHKKRSHQSKEFWLNKGFSEDDSIKKAKKTMDMIHDKTWTKRRENPELYDNVNTTQLKYWIDKGYSEEEAIIKRAERQTTFSLNICKEKYGDEKGKEVWLDRQEKWHKNYKKSNFSKVSQELFWSLYNKIEIDKSNIKFATLKNGKLDDSGSNNELRLRLDRIVLPDFIDLNTKKIIEFNGGYYHNVNFHDRQISDEKRNHMIIEYGYELLIIDERDYYKDKLKEIEKCVKFLTK